MLVCIFQRGPWSSHPWLVTLGFSFKNKDLPPNIRHIFELSREGRIREPVIAEWVTESLIYLAPTWCWQSEAGWVLWNTRAAEPGMRGHASRTGPQKDRGRATTRGYNTLSHLLLCVVLIYTVSLHWFTISYMCITLYVCVMLSGASQVALLINLPVHAGDKRDAGSIFGSGRSPGVGSGNPLNYSCLKNPMDRGAWRATVHGVTGSRKGLSDRAHTHNVVRW